MLERRLRTVVLASLAMMLLPACAHFTQSGRQQLAYARYVRKQTHNRVKMTTKYKKIKVPNSTASEPKITGTLDGPQSMSQGQTSAPSQPLTAPASDSSSPTP